LFPADIVSGALYLYCTERFIGFPDFGGAFGGGFADNPRIGVNQQRRALDFWYKFLVGTLVDNRPGKQRRVELMLGFRPDEYLFIRPRKILFFPFFDNLFQGKFI
jgi:hypothetical protein